MHYMPYSLSSVDDIPLTLIYSIENTFPSQFYLFSSILINFASLLTSIHTHISCIINIKIYDSSI